MTTNDQPTPVGRTRLTLLLLCAFTVGVAAQQNIDTSGARILAPNASTLIIRGLEVNNEAVDVTIVADASGQQWEVAAVEVPAPGPLPDDLYLDLARLSVVDGRTILLEDVLVGTGFVRGAITFNDELTRVSTWEFVETDPPSDNPLLAALVALLAETDVMDSPEPEATPALPDPPNNDARLGDGIPTADLPNREPGAVLERPDAPVAADPAVDGADVPEPPQATGEAAATVDEPTAPAQAVGEVPATSDGEQPGEGDALVDRAVSEIEMLLDALWQRASREAAGRFDQLEAAIAELSALASRAERAIADVPTAAAAAVAAATPPVVERIVTERVVVEPASDVERLAADDVSPTISLATARTTFAILESVDLSASTSASGSWRTEATRAVQSSPEAYFAKLRLDYVQDSRPRLYRMLVRALDPGWAGLGIHLSVTGVERARGFGHGESLLVWLTRDESAYGTEATFLEVYNSYDDVTMDRAAQARTDVSLSDTVALEILVDPAGQFVTLAVDGIEYVRYRFSVPRGASVELALRSLGRAEFRDLEVRRR